MKTEAPLGRDALQALTAVNLAMQLMRDRPHLAVHEAYSAALDRLIGCVGRRRALAAVLAAYGARGGALSI